jgi:hypothetical protein
VISSSDSGAAVCDATGEEEEEFDVGGSNERTDHVGWARISSGVGSRDWSGENIGCAAAVEKGLVVLFSRCAPRSDGDTDGVESLCCRVTHSTARWLVPRLDRRAARHWVHIVVDILAGSCEFGEARKKRLHVFGRMCCPEYKNLPTYAVVLQID